jgi:hypothetical protein
VAVPADGEALELGHPANRPTSQFREIAAADDDTAFAFQETLAGRWATAIDDRTTRMPGESWVRLRCCFDPRQEFPVMAGPTAEPTTP